MHSQSPAEFLLAAFGHWLLLHFCHVHGWSLHVTQELLPGRLPWPLGQEVQVAAPAAEYLPAGQVWHDSLFAFPACEDAVPAGHAWQALARLTRSDADCVLPYVPAGQSEQAALPAGE